MSDSELEEFKAELKARGLTEVSDQFALAYMNFMAWMRRDDKLH